MKKAVLYFILCNVVLLLANEVFGGFGMIKGKQYFNNDSLPACLKKLSRPGSKSIRSSIGSMQYRNEITLKNGKKLYAFSAMASIGCYINDPAGTRYYNDSCTQVASFYNGFTLKKGKRPFIAKGYSWQDFPEAATGDYPAYFASLQLKQ